MSHLKPSRAATILAALLVPVALAAGCASSGKLAENSGKELAKGDVRKAWNTALRAIEKNPYDQRAIQALSASGQALLNHEARRFRGIVVMDTLAAADVSLGMDDVRRQVAEHGALVASDAETVAQERLVRARVAAWRTADGDAAMQEDRPKDAWASYREAARYHDDARITAKIEKAHSAGTDRVLLMPWTIDTRARIDETALSNTMRSELHRFATDELTFTDLTDPGATKARRGRGPSDTREAAFAAAEANDATRVVWSRIHGDRIETHSETYVDVVYRKSRVRQPDGSTVTRWDEVPVLVRIEDRWVSAEVECEVHDLAADRVVARRASDHGAGLRIVHTLSLFGGSADDYALYTPEQWAADRDGCQKRVTAWEERFGGLTVGRLVTQAKMSAKTAVGPTTTRHGAAVRAGRKFAVAYGILPGEADLLASALADAWKEVAATLEEADRS